MTEPASYLVPVKTTLGQVLTARIEPAKKDSLPTDWAFEWDYIWEITSFDCEAIIQLTVEGNLWGLIRYGLYPFPAQKPNFLWLHHLEAHPARRPPEEYAYRRSPPSPPNPYVDPVGRWLMWNICRTALDYCNHEPDPLIVVEAKSNAVDYYRDVIGMTMVNTTVSSIGVDNYAFHFTRDQAEAFCLHHRTQYGDPQQISAL